ncbi:hypothetical protein E2C01_061533 [Portunus trituberculatus]|uniref:Uncharacterized protein n=1 Tax=Portunus trituberculatus TaxID=210409 RepID=A0A5B7HEM6_PORTR|nr:hypothetical protein [Portunus trituberculatus]
MFLCVTFVSRVRVSLCIIVSFVDDAISPQIAMPGQGRKEVEDEKEEEEERNTYNESEEGELRGKENLEGTEEKGSVLSQTRAAGVSGGRGEAGQQVVAVPGRQGSRAVWRRSPPRGSKVVACTVNNFSGT